MSSTISRSMLFEMVSFIRFRFFEIVVGGVVCLKDRRSTIRSDRADLL